MKKTIAINILCVSVGFFFGVRMFKPKPIDGFIVMTNVYPMEIQYTNGTMTMSEDYYNNQRTKPSSYHSIWLWTTNAPFHRGRNLVYVGSY